MPHDEAFVSRVLAEARADAHAALERVFARREGEGLRPAAPLSPAP